MPRWGDVLDRIGERLLVGDDHWPWTGCKDGSGYGRTTYKGKQRPAHRVIYELVVGPIPDGMDLDHLCRIKHCCRPACLEPVSRGENIRRGYPYRPRKLTCPNGHPWIDENIRVRRSQGGVKRECWTCIRQQNTEAKRRMRERRRHAS